jgi:hypothetical protein
MLKRVHQLTKDLVKVGFERDEELFSKYHIQNGSENECIEHTYHRIQDLKEETHCFYEIIYNDKAIGFCCFDDNLLYSFGINVDYRSGDVLREWISDLDSLFIGKYAIYMVTFYKKNTRAKDFFIKNGFYAMPYEEIPKEYGEIELLIKKL